MTAVIDWFQMQKKNTPESLFAFIKTIKSRQMRTNGQWTINTLQEKYDNNRLWISIESDIAIILLKDTENVLRLTYYAKDVDSLSHLLRVLPVIQAPIICDLLGKMPSLLQYSEELKQIGMVPYAQYQRMQCIDLTIDESIDTTEVQVARSEDADEIFSMLHDEFDVITARMPEKNTIRRRIEDKDVFVIRKSNLIAGFIVFDSRNKKSALLEYVMVRPEYREMHIAKKIWNYKLKYENESKYYYLWVNTDRKIAVKFHESNGYRFDGLIDNIFLIPNK